MASPLLTIPNDLLPDAEEGEFWTAAQRAGNPLHEVPYRACFKPQLAKYFIRDLSQPDEIVMDPFMGRGTTLLEASLNNRIPWGNDANPLSRLLIRPRLNPPTLTALRDRLAELRLESGAEQPADLLAFYHPQTLDQLLALRRHLATEKLDAVDDWIRMVALTRLSGHSRHFFSVYTLPPNQAVTAERQRKINARLRQVPEIRDVKAILLRKSEALLKQLTATDRQTLARGFPRSRLATGMAEWLPEFPRGSVKLIVTSPPFLDEVQYRADNWLRCWFAGIDAQTAPISELRSLHEWQEMMTGSLREWHRVLRPDGRAVVEVGEIRKGSIQLEYPLAEAAEAAGFAIERFLINRQTFTKTSNCWGISNQAKGTNTNRILVLRPLGL